MFRNFYLVILFLIFLLILPVYSQVNLEWARCYNGTANFSDEATAISVDDSGNVYVTGLSQGIGSNYDYVTIKYDNLGNEIWIRRFDENNTFQVAHDLVADNLGNVYVTGGSQTLKYNFEGNLVWVLQNNAECRRIIYLNDSNIYAGGSSYGDYKLLKFTSNGNIVWEKLYNGLGNNLDRLYDMTMDSKGNIIVTGRSHGIGTHWDYATVKYNSDGDSLWVRRYNGPCTSFPGDYPYSITVDDSDNVYVTGRSDGINCNPQCFTIAYSSTGDTLWEQRFPNAGSGYDVLYSKGFIYVVARSSTGDFLIKYDKQGNLVWTFNYSSNLLFAVYQPRIVSDKKGFLYLKSQKASNFTLIKISSMGEMIWEYLYPDQANTGAGATSLILDKNNNIYMTGTGTGVVCPGSDTDYLTLKLSQDKVGIDPNSEIVSDYYLFQNYPNPFNPITTIKFSIPKTEFVTLKIFDLLGKDVITLLSEKRSPGNYNVSLDASNLASGIYYYQLTAGEFSQTRKLILLR